MKILFVLENYFPNLGGVETLFKSLVEELEREGMEIVILTTRLSTADPVSQQLGNIRIIRLPFPNRYFFTLFAFFPILWYQRGCSLVHTTSYNAGLPAFFAAKLARKRIIITFHEVWSDLWFRLPFMSKPIKWGHYLFEQFLLRLPFDKFIAVSKNTASCLEKAGVAPHKITTIYNGVNYDELMPLPEVRKREGFHYTFFGRLGISKGLDLMLDAAAIYQNLNPESSLTVIVPKKPEALLNIFKKIIQEKKLSDYIILKHELPFEELKKEIAMASCVVVPSYSEGFCFAAVECMALGTPVISSDQGALKEVISGRFIKMKNFNTEDLVKALQDAHAGKWTETPLRKFELSATTNNYLKLYREILQYVVNT